MRRVYTARRKRPRDTSKLVRHHVSAQTGQDLWHQPAEEDHRASARRHSRALSAGSNICQCGGGRGHRTGVLGAWHGERCRVGVIAAVTNLIPFTRALAMVGGASLLIHTLVAYLLPPWLTTRANRISPVVSFVTLIFLGLDVGHLGAFARRPADDGGQVHLRQGRGPAGRGRTAGRLADTPWVRGPDHAR